MPRNLIPPILLNWMNTKKKKVEEGKSCSLKHLENGGFKETKLQHLFFGSYITAVLAVLEI